MSVNKMQSELALRVVVREDAGEILKMMLWDLKLVSVVKKLVIPFLGLVSTSLQYHTISTHTRSMTLSNH
jgi:hypothetical protein